MVRETVVNSSPESPYSNEVIAFSRLYIVHLLLCRLLIRGNNVRIYYHRLGIVGWISHYILKVPYPKISRICSALTGFKVERLPDGSTLSNYSELFQDSMCYTTLALENLSNKLRDFPVLSRLGRFLGPDPSLSFILRWLSKDLFRVVLIGKVLAHIAPEQKKIHLIDDMGLSEPIFSDLQIGNLALFPWPLPVRFCFSFLVRFRELFIVWALLVSRIIHRGITFSSRKPNQEFLVAIELCDPYFLNGTARDYDFWIDNSSINKENCLFFMSAYQEHFLRKSKISKAEVELALQNKGYQYCLLSSEPYFWSDIIELIKIAVSLSGVILRSTNPCLIRGSTAAWKYLTDFYTLFSHRAIKNVLSTSIPNGQATIKIDSSIITGLARRFGTRSIGYQTRIIYALHHDFFYDCYDLFLSWGSGWVEFYSAGIKLIPETKTMGCPTGDELVKSLSSGEVKSDKSKNRVLIFPTDVSDSLSPFTYRYMMDFLTACGNLAAKNPEIEFTLKFKDPEHVEDFSYRPITLQDGTQKKVAELMSIASSTRHKYSELLSASDIVLAIGFTTPGFEGLLANKPTIFFAPKYMGGGQFLKIPGLVAPDYEQLKYHFDSAVKNRSQFVEQQQSFVASLEPFRDGESKKRAVEYILG